MDENKNVFLNHQDKKATPPLGGPENNNKDKEEAESKKKSIWLILLILLLLLGGCIIFLNKKSNFDENMKKSLSELSSEELAALYAKYKNYDGTWSGNWENITFG